MNRGARTLLAVVFLAFVLVGSYYVWTGPEAPPLGERAALDLEPPGAAETIGTPAVVPQATSATPARDLASRRSNAGIPLAAVEDAGSPPQPPPQATSSPGSPPRVRTADASARSSARGPFGVIEVRPRPDSTTRAPREEGDDDGGEVENSAETSSLRRVAVETGDTLTSIARRHLGDGRRWMDLYLANRETIGPDPNALRVGQVLQLPADPR